MQDPAELDVIRHFNRVAHFSQPFVSSQSDSSSSVVYCVHVLWEILFWSLNRTSDLNKHEIIQHLRKSDVSIVEVVFLNVTDTVLMFVLMSCIPGCGISVVTVTHPQCVRIH